MLLDTHVLIWALQDQLEAAAGGVIVSAENQVYVSAASPWEIAIKRAAGKLRAPQDAVAASDAAGFDRLPITFEHAAGVADLPLHHRDPFDRLLISQARIEGLTLATADPAISRYEIAVLPVARATGARARP